MSEENWPRQRSPRFAIAHLAPGCMCECGHREGSHNDLGRCCAGECSCGGYPYASREEWAGFRPVDGPCAEREAKMRNDREGQL